MSDSGIRAQRRAAGLEPGRDKTRSIRVAEEPEDEYLASAGHLKKSLGLAGTIYSISNRLMEMVVASGQKLVLTMGFKSGFALWPNENADAKNLIDALLRYTKNHREDEKSSGGSGRVQLS